MEQKLISNNSQYLIQEAIKKIALGRSLDRINMSPSGTGGVGTARMIHGYICKIHEDPNDEEYPEYSGTVDVREFVDETSSSEAIIHKGVFLSGLKNNSGGFLIIPTLYSDVTIVSDAATKYSYILNYSHANIIQLQSHTESRIGVTETEELNPDDNSSPDYDELQTTGNETASIYTASQIDTTIKNKSGKKSNIKMDAENIQQTIEKSCISQSASQIEQKVNSTGIIVADNKITIGEQTAIEPLVLGNQLAQLMLEFLLECSKITTPTLMGTMPAINFPNFASLTSKIQNFLSQTAFTK